MAWIFAAPRRFENKSIYVPLESQKAVENSHAILDKKCYFRGVVRNRQAQ